jgi:hypothetical protein
VSLAAEQILSMQWVGLWSVSRWFSLIAIVVTELNSWVLSAAIVVVIHGRVGVHNQKEDSTKAGSAVVHGN